MSKPDKYIASDESLNSYGFWVLTEGIRLERFLNNPLMLWNHHRSAQGKEDDVLPIGNWPLVYKKKNELLCEGANFDEKDPFALKIKNKVDGGFIRTLSIGITVFKTSTDPKYLLPGQTRPTVIDCELKEISFCDIPSNGNAVALALYDEFGDEINLSEGEDNFLLPLLSDIQNQEQDMELKDFRIALNLNESSTAEQVLQAFKDRGAENTQLKQENTELKTQVQTYKDKELSEGKAKAKSLVDNAIKEGKLSEEARVQFTELAENNYELAEKTIAGIRVDLRGVGEQGGEGLPTKFKDKTWDELDKAGLLEELKEVDQGYFEKLKEEKFK